MDPGGDFDGDGICNACEDTNFNCIFDEGESDPRLADTDADGLEDGDEDIDRNGFIDVTRGECDPRLPDTDGDGVLDGEDPNCGATGACTLALFDAIGRFPAPYAKSHLALPADFHISPVAAASAAIFADAKGKTFGFVTVQPSSGEAGADMGHALVKVAMAGFAPTLLFSQEFALPDPAWAHLQEMPLPATRGQRGDYFFSLSGGSEGAASLRDTALSAISGASIASGDSSVACERVRSHVIATLRPDNEVLITAIFACDDDYEANQDIRFVFEDLFSVTTIAPGDYGPDDFSCEAFASSLAGKLDVLWVIDNSYAMSDEQTNVTATANKFMATLAASGVDWRIAVTTTEAYLLETDPSSLHLAHDELLDIASGLRGAGFISPDSPDFRQLFERYVAYDEGCIKTLPGQTEPIAPEGANVCGFGMERGLQSGLWVLERTGRESRMAYARRPDATTLVIWLSDEEDGAFKDDLVTGTPAPTAAQATALIDQFIVGYSDLQARAYAIVGDQGIGAGGVCEQIFSAATQGAELGAAYIAVAAALGGGHGVICNDDLQPTIDHILMESLGISSDAFALRNVPISSSIRVTVDGVAIPRGDTTQGWVYNASTNSVQFFGVEMKADSAISVGYVLWRRLEG